VVPARGKVVAGAELKTFHDMIVTVRDRVQRMIDAGKTEQQILDEYPTSDFDGQFGHGRVPPDSFVRSIYAVLKKL